MINRPDWTGGTDLVPAQPDPNLPAGHLDGDWGDGAYTAYPIRERTATDVEIADIEKLMRTDRAAYFKSPEKQARYHALLARRAGEADGDLADIPPAALATVSEIKREIGRVGDWEEFEGSFDSLPQPILAAVADELSNPAASSSDVSFEDVRGLAPQVDLQSFSSGELARIHGRVWRIFDRLWAAGRESEFDRLLGWFSRVPPLEAHAVLQALAR